MIKGLAAVDVSQEAGGFNIKVPLGQGPAALDGAGAVPAGDTEGLGTSRAFQK